MNKTILVFCISLLLIVEAYCQQEYIFNQDKFYAKTREEIISLQQAQRQQNGGVYANSQSYVFMANTTDKFNIQVMKNETIRGQSFVYWQKDKVFISSEPSFNEEIRLIITCEGQTLFDNSFYTMTGFNFQAVKDKLYQLQFRTKKSSINKLVTFTVNTIVPKIHQQAGKMMELGVMTSTQTVHLQSYLEHIKTSHLMELNVFKKVLELSQRYMMYQIFQALAVGLTTVFQIMLIKRLLQPRTVV